MSTRETRSGRAFVSPSNNRSAARGGRGGRRSQPSSRVGTPAGSQRSGRSVSTLGSAAGEATFSSDSTPDQDDESVASLVPSTTKSATPGSHNRNHKGKPNSGFTNQRGISAPFQKLLAEDIQKAGGIQHVRANLTSFGNDAARVDPTRQSFLRRAKNKRALSGRKQGSSLGWIV